jgi:L,D-peptidoglycan transpeptidase YkuD (ErfK/YbiS/YcfS/YnhG family)
VAVTLGRTGLAWGVGQGRPPAGTPADARGKREGDGRSPAGAYPLVAAFGYEPSGAAAPSAAARLPFHAVTDGSVCVDDPASALYNAVADSAAARSARPDARWASAERMRRVAGYRRGAVVGYNGARVLGASRVAAPAAPAPGRGSCIFLHVWDGAGRPTEGCTAMAEPDMAAALAWLDPAARPALVQLPAPALARLRAPWRLPAP